MEFVHSPLRYAPTGGKVSVFDAGINDSRGELGGGAAGAAVLNHDGDGKLRSLRRNEGDEPAMVEMLSFGIDGAIPGRLGIDVGPGAGFDGDILNVLIDFDKLARGVALGNAEGSSLCGAGFARDFDVAPE